ncbi:hypothetical protein NIES4075_67020 [Tolypothrix sp. NIES-4075]|uniref:eCIS core domain-containing protein n=1 Tax=Tolypothrix sp. NIES-4075 TaxID=2005459 RepID=UPI000B5C21A5|nr:DUF4157 domain-containing protein [Tolypothrix sp. NIES-4075]GAX45681.1 hypothetical protein NIES4075_67020 [Tolypothrix sp. NIES-4075]
MSQRSPLLDPIIAPCPNFSHKNQLQRQRDNGSSTNLSQESKPTEVPPVVHEVLSSPGHPLDSNTRSLMEVHLGHDFSQVQIHTDGQAAVSTKAVNALAYTVGQDIVFGADQYEPNTSKGQHLLAHELVHTLQQGTANQKEPSALGVTDPSDRTEQEAETAANGVTQNQPLPTMLSKAPTAAPKIARQPAPAPTASAAPASPPPANTWEADVNSAKAIADPTQRRDALVALVKKSLGTTYQVHVAGNSSPTQVDPKDYKMAPVINFDVNLNNKQSWPSKPGAPTRSLGAKNNAGYSFSSGADFYAVIGPEAVDPASPLITLMYAEHELYHTQHHLGKNATPGMSSDDQEVETWTQDFLKFFHQYLSIPLPARPAWSPLIEYYEKATPAAQQNSLNKLVNYYNQPPVPPTDVSKVQRAFHSWLNRRLKDSTTATKKLITDLDKTLPKLPSTTVTPAAPTPSAPTPPANP